MPSDPKIVRTRTTHGWAFVDLSAEAENRVKAYLADGDPNHLLNTKYLDARAGVLSRLTNKERRDNGLPIKRIEKPEPAPEAPADDLPCGHDHDDPNHIHGVAISTDDTALVFVVMLDGHTMIQSELPPHVLLNYFQSAVSAMEDAIKKNEEGRN